MAIKPYIVRIAPAAKRQLDTLTHKQRNSLIKIIESLSVNPRPLGVKKIEGMTGLYRQIINNTKLIYKIEDQEILLLIIK